MKVWGLFNGGSGYSPGSVHELRDIEEFSSLRVAGITLYDRVAGNIREFPNVDRDASFHIFFAHPHGPDGVQEYPDRVMTIGPRGGVRIERA
jgi:hypothetical protein